MNKQETVPKQDLTRLQKLKQNLNLKSCATEAGSIQNQPDIDEVEKSSSLEWKLQLVEMSMRALSPKNLILISNIKLPMTCLLIIQNP
jgi:hypothetical protein